MNGKECGGGAHGGGGQEEGAGPGENSCVGANAEADGEDGNRGRAAVLGEGPQRVSSVAKNSFEPRERAAFTVGLAGLLRATHMDECLSACFCRAESGANEIVGMKCDVRIELGGEVGIGSACAKETEETK